MGIETLLVIAIVLAGVGVRDLVPDNTSQPLRSSVAKSAAEKDQMDRHLMKTIQEFETPPRKPRRQMYPDNFDARRVIQDPRHADDSWY